MRIGVDATSWTNRRGYGRFARNALSRLVELDAETAYVFVVDEESGRSARLPAGAETLTVALSRAPARAAASASYRRPADLLRLAVGVSRARFDALLFPSVYTYFPSLGVPTVVGLHDLIASDLPELTLPRSRDRLFWQAKERLAIRLARRLFTVSESARDRISARLRIPTGRLGVVPEAPDPVFWPRAAAEVEAALAAVGLPAGRRYLLYAGGISPHKDVETLLVAFATLKEGGAAGDLAIVVAGALEDEAYLSAAGSVRRAVIRLGLGSDVLLPGFVDDEVLAGLYSGAVALVSPSLAEGFGLPPVEAAACGAPVVLSDIPAHRETLAGEALYFPPGDADALAEHLRRLLGSEVLRRSLAERGHRRVARYTWDAAAEALRALLGEAVDG